MNKNKKALYISLFALDIAVTITLFVISIVALVQMPKDPIGVKNATGMIKFFLDNTWAFPVLIVVPLFLLLAANIGFLYFYVKKANAKKKVQLNDLSEEQKEALKAELLKDIDKKDE